jgi:hypothetical protein
MDRVAALFVMATGFYLTWYWYASITDRVGNDGLTTRVERWNDQVHDFFSRLGVWTLVVLFAVPVGAAIAYVSITRTRRAEVDR